MLKILCSGHLVRYPVGGFSWHHLQYLVGLHRLGHEVAYFEHYGWEGSCYDPSRDVMTSDPTFGVEYLRRLLASHGLQAWCYLSEDGTAHGMAREELAELCRDADVYFNLSNINWVPELMSCRRRILVDTDPVFTQLGGHGVGGPFGRYDRLFSYGENVHRPGCQMPDGGTTWMATRQPVVLDLWPPSRSHPAAPYTTIMNWSSLGELEHQGRAYGQKDREFQPFFSLPSDSGEHMQIAVNGPKAVRERLAAGGWEVVDAQEVSRGPDAYQQYLRSSLAEFSVAKHAYVTTGSGWFSDRSTGYLALGRPCVVQDTGFSDFLPCGEGLLPWRSKDDVLAAMRSIREDYDAHCQAARGVVEEYFDADAVLTRMLESIL